MIDTILLVGALFVAAQDGDAAAVAAPAVDPDNRRECRVVGETGSRLSRRRVCATRAEWAAEDAAQRATLNEGRQRMIAPVYDEMVNGSRAGPMSGGSQPNVRCARC